MEAYLPARLGGKTRNLHAIYRTTRSGCTGTVRRAIKRLLMTGPTRKLDGQPFSLEVATVCRVYSTGQYISWEMNRQKR